MRRDMNIGAILIGMAAFAAIPMFRLEGTEHMDAACHQKWFHARGMLFPGTILR